jgi:hypothetical protein
MEVLRYESIFREIFMRLWANFFFATKFSSDFGPREAVPLVCIPGVTGTAESFYKQLVSLGPKGYRVISVRYGAAPIFRRSRFIF